MPTLSVAWGTDLSIFSAARCSESLILAPTFADVRPVGLSPVAELGLGAVNLKPSVSDLGVVRPPGGDLRPGVLPARPHLLVAVKGA